MRREIRLILILIFAIILECDSKSLRKHGVIKKVTLEITDGRKYQRIPGLMFPGTYWCGAGNISPDNKTLGILKEVDYCCREHDRCPDIIKTGEIKYGLINTSFYYKLNCSCDDKFYRCLKNNKDRVSDIIGQIYFNMLSTQCFSFDYEIVKCLEYTDLFGRKCVSYEFDETKPKSYQWFDEPQY